MSRKQELSHARERIAQLVNEREERRAASERALLVAMRDMNGAEFVIVTASGYVVKGIATSTAITAENMGGFPGSREYSASIVIKPNQEG